MLSLKKTILFSIFTPWFFIRKFISVAELFLRGGCNSLKWTYVEGGGTCETNMDKQGEWRGSKTGSFEGKYFLNGSN